MRRTSTKISAVSVHIRLPNITKSGSIVSGPPPLIIMVFSLVLMPLSSHEMELFPVYGVRDFNGVKTRRVYTFFLPEPQNSCGQHTNAQQLASMPNDSSKHVHWGGGAAWGSGCRGASVVADGAACWAMAPVTCAVVPSVRVGNSVDEEMAESDCFARASQFPAFR